MKQVLLTALCAIGFSAVATAGQVVYTDYDQVLGVGRISVSNACVTATEVKTIAPIKVCKKLVETVVPAHGEANATYSEWNCESWATENVSSLRAFNRTYCSEMTQSHEGDNAFCSKYSQKADFLPDTIKINVVTTSANEGGDNFPGIFTTFTFPACK